jgi:hypothetical protein
VKAERVLLDGSGAVLTPRGAQRGSERGTEMAAMGDATVGTTAAKTAPKKKNMVMIEEMKCFILYVA